MANTNPELLLMVSKAFQAYAADVAKELVKNPPPKQLDNFTVENAGSVMMAFCMMGFCHGNSEKFVAERIYKTFKGEGDDNENVLKTIMLMDSTSEVVH